MVKQSFGKTELRKKLRQFLINYKLFNSPAWMLDFKSIFWEEGLPKHDHDYEKKIPVARTSTQKEQNRKLVPLAPLNNGKGLPLTLEFFCKPDVYKKIAKITKTLANA